MRVNSRELRRRFLLRRIDARDEDSARARWSFSFFFASDAFGDFVLGGALLTFTFR